MNNTKEPIDGKDTATPASRHTSALQGASRFEKYATTQATGDGIEGDASKTSGKTEDEKLGAQMPDRK
jgi:hypothetical protein